MNGIIDLRKGKKPVKSLKFLHINTNSVIIGMEKSILINIIPDKSDEGMFFVEIAKNGGNIETIQFSFMPGTIMKTFNLTTKQFLTYIN